MLIRRALPYLSLGLLLLLTAAPTWSQAGTWGTGGPAVPVRVDDSDDGPDGGDAPVVPLEIAPGVEGILSSVFDLENPWSQCSSVGLHRILTADLQAFGGVEGSDGIFDTFTRLLPNEEEQEVAIGGFDGNGDPVFFNFREELAGQGGQGGAYGTVEVLDPDNDGLYEEIRLTPTGGAAEAIPTAMTIPLMGYDGNGDGVADYIGVPDALMLVETEPCGAYGAMAVPWAPMVDDGEGHLRIVVDPRGTGGDPRFFRSPPLDPALPRGPVLEIPTTSQIGLLLLALLLLTLATRTLRRRGTPIGA